MARRKILLLCVVLFTQHILHASAFLPEAEERARAEEKAISSISLKALEEMVEKDDNIRRIRDEKLAFLVNPKYKENIGPSRRSFESPLRPDKYFGEMPFDDEIIAATERIAEASNHVNFFDQYAPESSLFDKLDDLKDGFHSDNDFSASEIFSTRSEASEEDEDTHDEKLTNRKQHSPLSLEKAKKERNCKTVVKKVMDDDGVQHPEKPTRVKSVIISKECEYPEDLESDFDPSISPLSQRRYVPHRMKLTLDTDESRAEDDSQVEDDNDYHSYSNDRNDRVLRNPLHSDYIDRMFETHFSQLRSYKMPLSFPKQIRERKLKADESPEEPQLVAHQRPRSSKYPEEGKPSSPFSSSNKNNYNRNKPVSKRLNNPRVHYHEASPLKKDKKSEGKSDLKPSVDSEHDEEEKTNSTPKVTKKTFAYYRKDNPKDDPNNQEYAEEYHQGNYRSFSTDYDSDRDGPK